MLPFKVALVLAAFPEWGGASTDNFLAATASSAAQDWPLMLLGQLDEVLGSEQRQTTESVLKAIAEAMQPTVRSLPTNARGTLSASSARYLLHRLFVQRHGWVLRGAAPDGGSWLPSSTVLGVGSHLPPWVRELFEANLGRDDEYAPHEVFLLAATIEALAHDEAKGRLEATYRVLGKDIQGQLDDKEAALVTDVYLQSVFVGENISELSRQEAEDHARDFSWAFPYWPQVRQSVDEAHQRFAPGLRAFAFSDMSRILEGTDERLAHHLDESNCQEMRGVLTQMQDRSGSGRVRLHDFYKSVMDGRAWQFSEGVDYLRQSGMLDESGASQPRLIIANYLYMHGDCLPVSSFYDLCCINPCEGLMSHLEHQVQAPAATPEEIMRAVSALPAQSAPGTRTSAPELVKKLEDVARNHGGRVPLHGRLFAQWMHFAYPLECPYPHVSGTTRLMSNTAWYEERGENPTLNESQMMTYMESLRAETASSDAQAVEQESNALLAMWSDEEELMDAADGPAGLTLWELAPRPAPRGVGLGVRAGVLLAVLALWAAWGWGFARRSPASPGAARGTKSGAAAESERALLSI